jgi:hypothetical protein
VPRAGLEPNLGEKKLLSGRAVTPHRLVLTRVFLPPSPNQYRHFRTKTALEGSTGAARKYPVDHSERAPFHIELPSLFPFRRVRSCRVSIVARRSKNDFMNRAAGRSGGEIKREISAHRGRPEIACSHRP